MRASAAPPRSQGNSKAPRASQPRRITTIRHCGPDQAELGRHEDNFFGALDVPYSQGDGLRGFNDSATESRPHTSSPKRKPALVVSSPATPITKGPVLLADSVHMPCEANLGLVEQAAIREAEEAGNQKVAILAPSRTEAAIGASQEKVDEVRSAPLVEAHSDTNGQPENISTTGTSVGATQSTVAEREEAKVRVNTQVASPPSRLRVESVPDSYPKCPHGPNMQVDQVDMQVDFSGPTDKDEEKSEPSFGILSNTAFDPLLAYPAQPQSYSHGPSTEEGDSIIEGTGPTFVADSVMEDARTEPWKADVSVTAAETLQPFSWVPSSISDAFRATFPGVQFARTQMTPFFNGSLPVLQYHPLSDQYAMDTTISEDTRLWQGTPPQDIPWSLGSDGVHPSPSLEVGSPKEPQYVYAKHSSTPVLSDFASQTTSGPSLPPPSPPGSRIGPVPVLPTFCGPTDGHQGEVKYLGEEVGPEPAVVVGLQRETSLPRCV